MRPRIEKHFYFIALAFLAAFLFGCACETPLQDPAYSDQSALPQETRRLRKTYPATHSLMGYRRALARDLIGFIQGKSETGETE